MKWLQATAMDNFRPDQRWLKDYLERSQQEFEYRYDKPQSVQDSIRNYTLIRTLGCGSFGRVMLAKPGSGDFNTSVIAIKILIKEKIVKMKQVEHTINEKRILYAVGTSPFIVHCLRAFKDTTNLYMVMNFVNGGELFLYLRRKGRLSESHSRFYAAQVTLALQYLHNCNVIYRDLKPENILLDHKGYLKMTDFGFAKRTTSHSWTLCGTPQYLAPEMIHNKAYNKSVDYWGLGILIYELNAGYPPFEHKVPIKLYEKICEGKVDYPSYFSNELVHLVKNLLQLDVTRRYGNMRAGAMDIINHSWYKDTDFRRILEKSIIPPWEPNLSGPMDVSNFEKFNEEVISISKTDKYPEEFLHF